MKPIGRLHVITDESVQSRFSHVEIAKLAVEGGADVIQFRDKKRPAGELIDIAASIRDVCRGAGAAFIVNDRIDVAIAIDADGVHLGQSDLPIAEARKLLGPGKIIGGTASNVEDALEAQRDGADYVGFGHIYPTSSKDKPTPAKGPEALLAVVGAVSIPVVAIGGITAENLPAVVETGVHGVAVIGAVCASEDPRGAARELRSILLRHSTR